MKKLLFSIFIMIFFNYATAQIPEFTTPEDSKNAITVGVLQGGGSLIGADLEFLLVDKLGVQIGAGLIGFGAGLNYHFKPSVRSSFLSFQYWNQGVGDGFVQSMAGPNFVYRGKKWLTFQIGLGKTLKRGPAFPVDKEFPSVILMYSIGGYIPF